MTRNKHIALGLVGALLMAGSAFAQLGGNIQESSDSKMEPPTPSFKAEEGGEVAAIFIAVLLVALAAGVNLIPTKRGHQD